MKNTLKPLLLTSVAVAATLSLAGCSPAVTSGTNGSRSVIYESVDQLLADSSTVVVAKVTSQAQEGEWPQIFTVSTVTVGETFAPAAIAPSLTDRKLLV